MATVDVRPLDSSVIATIGDRAGDPMGSVAKAYSLANMVDQNQMNKLALSQAEEDRAKQQDIERIVKAGKYDTPQGYWDTGAALTKAGHPEAAQSFLKLGSDVSTGKYTQQIQKLDLAARNQDVIAGAFDNIVSKVTALQNAPGKPPSEDTLNALTRTMAIADANDLKKNHPELAAQVDQFLKDPANLTYSGIMELERKSNVGQQLLAQTRASLQLSANLAKDRATTAETEARTKALQEGRLVPVQMPDGSVQYVPSSQAAGAKVGKVGGSGFGMQQATTPAGQALQRSFAELGDRVSYGQMRMFNFDQIAADPKYKGMSPDQVAATIVGNIQHTAAGQQVRTAFDKGKQGDTVRSLNVAIQHLSVLSDIGSKLDNDNVRSVNALYQALGKQFGTTAPVNFDFAKQIVGDEVVKAVVGSNAGSVSDRQNLQGEFSRASTPAQLAGVIQTAQQLMSGQLKGLRDQFVSGLSGVSSAKDATAEFDAKLDPATRKALEGRKGDGAATLPPTNAQGWRLMKDAQGNQAYVSPDGKQFQEVQ